MDPLFAGNLELARHEIDRMDDMIIELLKRRRKLSDAVGIGKFLAGEPKRDYTREDQIIEKYVDALGPQVGLRVCQAILGERD